MIQKLLLLTAYNVTVIRPQSVRLSVFLLGNRPPPRRIMYTLTTTELIKRVSGSVWIIFRAFTFRTEQQSTYNNCDEVHYTPIHLNCSTFISNANVANSCHILITKFLLNPRHRLNLNKKKKPRTGMEKCTFVLFDEKLNKHFGFLIVPSCAARWLSRIVQHEFI